ncbi:MAG: hypothetical protein AAB821_02630, partial [Patescibacteria group bacterium]
MMIVSEIWGGEGDSILTESVQVVDIFLHKLEKYQATFSNPSRLQRIGFSPYGGGYFSAEIFLADTRQRKVFRIPHVRQAVASLLSAQEKRPLVAALFSTRGDVLTFARTHFARAERVV